MSLNLEYIYNYYTALSDVIHPSVRLSGEPWRCQAERPHARVAAPAARAQRRPSASHDPRPSSFLQPAQWGRGENLPPRRGAALHPAGPRRIHGPYRHQAARVHRRMGPRGQFGPFGRRVRAGGPCRRPPGCPRLPGR